MTMIGIVKDHIIVDQADAPEIVADFEIGDIKDKEVNKQKLTPRSQVQLKERKERKWVEMRVKEERLMLLSFIIKGRKWKEMEGSPSILTFLLIWEDLKRKNKMFNFPSISLQLGSTKDKFCYEEALPMCPSSL
uniref:Uncharacterized protein n=1 Tax=Lactuca sativa TaxID=4236 RepID=A0A9R1WQP0_LACSA|nr:hypothetical protein LSAT_V11C100024070 [Lactuca sativa]